MKKKLKSDSPLRAATCSPSSGADEMAVVLSRDKTGKLGILSAPPIFLCTRESIEDMVTRHNELLEERDALRCEVVTLRVAAQGVIDRWETPLWKDAPATAKFINRLRAALSPENVKVSAPARKESL